MGVHARLMTSNLSCVCTRRVHDSLHVHVCSRAEEKDTSVVDVDGSYLYRKYRPLTRSGRDITQPNHPSPPPSVANCK